MKKTLLFIFALTGISWFSFCDQSTVSNESPAATDNGNAGSIEETNTNPRNLFFPALSYRFFSFGGFEFHEPEGGLTLMRITPAKRENMFMASLRYSPQIVTRIPPDFPELYHNASLMVMRKTGPHLINGLFSAMSEKPVYGGTHSFMAMAGYSYDLINGPHFSMDLGGALFVFDLGVRFANGMTWMVWPLPMVNLSWDYEWINIDFGMQGLQLTLGQDYPWRLEAAAGPVKLDAALWYRFFKNKNPAAEVAALGAGVKSESARVTISDGYRYGVKYETLYGAVRFFRFIELSGGWIFGGRTEYKKMDWTSMFESVSYPGASGNDDGDGGYFFSVSLRMFS